MSDGLSYFNRQLQSGLRNASLLQFKTTNTSEYLEVARKAFWWEGSGSFWELMPEYAITRCPIYNQKYREKIDTYSLRK